MPQLHSRSAKLAYKPPAASCHAKTRPLPMTLQLPDLGSLDGLDKGAPAALHSISG